MPPKYKKKTRGIYEPGKTKKFRISRSKLDLFHECPRCFYLDLRLGVRRPSFPAFTLNSAVDHLLKKEFDIHRAEGKPHPLMSEYGVDAVPFEHKDLDLWRNNFKGVSFYHEPTDFVVFGAIDDVWINQKDELHVVDYKATSKNDKPDLEGYWQQAYKRQMEIYQWLMRQNDFDVSDIGYFVYANGRKDEEAFDAKLEFDVDVIAYEGSTDWVEDHVVRAKKCLSSEEFPDAGEFCEYCPYREIAGSSIREHYKKTGKIKNDAPSKKKETDRLF